MSYKLPPLGLQARSAGDERVIEYVETMGVYEDLIVGVEEAEAAGFEQTFIVSAQAVDEGNQDAKDRFDNWIFAEPSGDGGDIVFWLEFTGDDPDMPEANLHVKFKDGFF